MKKNNIQEKFNIVFRNMQHSNIPDAAKMLKQIWQFAFEDIKNDQVRKNEWDDAISKDPSYTNQLVRLDPYLVLQRKQISKEKEG